MLSEDTGLADVEALMLRLASTSARDKAGDLVAEHLRTGGKRLRARLALAATEALGEPRHRALGWAAACELLHNGTLVHDDLQDGDRVRRGQPTTWVRHGAAHAINAGDLLLMLPFLALEEVPVAEAVRWTMARTLAAQAAAVIRGQAAELEMTLHGRAEWPVYLDAILGKTAALFELPVEGAALLVGHGPSAARALARPFRGLGVMFQMQDDVLDLYGDKGRDGRGADLREGKVSALVVEHLSLHPTERDAVLELLRLPREQTPQSDVDAMIARFREGGALAGVCATIRRDAASAVNAPELQSEKHLRELMRALVDRVLEPIAQVLATV